MALTVIIGVGLLLLFAVVLIGRKFANKDIVQYTVEETVERMKSPNTVLLDVRTHREREARSIPGSLHIPLHELAGRREELKEHQGKTIICYCLSGHRSIAAADQLGRAGFTAASLQGGITAWEKRGKKVDRNERTM